MSESEQAGALGHEIDCVIERFRQEFSMTYVAVIGVLEVKKQILVNEAIDLSKKRPND